MQVIIPPLKRETIVEELLSEVRRTPVTPESIFSKQQSTVNSSLNLTKSGIYSHPVVLIVFRYPEYLIPLLHATDPRQNDTAARFLVQFPLHGHSRSLTVFYGNDCLS